MSINNIRILSEPISYQEIKELPKIIIRGIYKIENLINHKVYIGQSVDVLDRIREDHLRLYTNEHLKNAFLKYGFDNFSFEILKETYDLDYWEIFLIQIYNSTDPQYGYNICLGGQGIGNMGERWRESLLKVMSTEEYHKRLSDSQQKRWSSEEERNKYSENTKKQWQDPEFRNKMLESRKGHVCSDECKKKIGSSNREIMLSKHLHWYTNGFEDVMATECPEGFWAGKSKTIKGMKMKPMSEEQKQYYRNIYTGVVWWNNGVEEVRSKTQPEGFVRGRLPKDKKYRWYTNGKENIMSDVCPKGFYLGRIVPKNTKKLSWYTNGVVNTRAETCPEGFWKGMIHKPLSEEHKRKLSESHKKH